MSAHAIERERFQVAMEAEGMTREISRRILRHAQTIQRLSEAECNGDWPCDNGERKVIFCARCEAGYVKSSMVLTRSHAAKPGTLICPNCRAQNLVREWCHAATVTLCATVNPPLRPDHATPIFAPIFRGDPHGACVELKVPSGRTDDGAREGVCVPTR